MFGRTVKQHFLIWKRKFFTQCLISNYTELWKLSKNQKQLTSMGITKVFRYWMHKPVMRYTQPYVWSHCSLWTMAENLSMTDELSHVHCTFLWSTSESICASRCNQDTEQDKLQLLSPIVVPMFLRLESSAYWEVNNGGRTKIQIAYWKGTNTSKPHFIK